MTYNENDEEKVVPDTEKENPNDTFSENRAQLLTDEVTENTEKNAAVNLEKSDEESNKDNVLSEFSYNDDGEEKKYTSQFGELEEYVEGYDKNDFTEEALAETNAKNKKKMKASAKITIAVIAVIVLAVLAAGVYFVFFNKAIQGKWIVNQTNDSTGQTSTAYYNFGDNYLEVISYDNYIYQKNTYTDVKYESNSFSIFQDGEVIIKFLYDVQGNLIQGKTLTLTIEGYGDEGKFDMTNTWDIPAYDSLQGPEFKNNDSIIGVWKKEDTSSLSYGYIEYVRFDENGFMTQYSGYNSRIVETVQKYNFDGKNITMKYDNEYSVEASVKNNKLSINTENAYVGKITVDYNKLSEEDFNKVISTLKAGEYEMPTQAQMNDDVQLPETETSDSTEITSETENVTETSTKS